MQCLNISNALGGVSLDEYVNNLILKSAVERFIINIGISASQIRQDYPEDFESFQGLRPAVGVRNRLAHGYGDVIDDERIWDMAQTSIPRLLKEIEPWL